MHKTITISTNAETPPAWHTKTQCSVFSPQYKADTVVLLKITRPKDREFVVKGMIAGTKDHEIGIATVVMSIPLFKF